MEPYSLQLSAIRGLLDFLYNKLVVGEVFEFQNESIIRSVIDCDSELEIRYWFSNRKYIGLNLGAYYIVYCQHPYPADVTENVIICEFANWWFYRQLAGDMERADDMWLGETVDKKDRVMLMIILLRETFRGHGDIMKYSWMIEEVLGVVKHEMFDQYNSDVLTYYKIIKETIE